MQLRASNIFIIYKSSLAFTMLFLGALFLFYGSLNVWPLWPFSSFIALMAFPFLLTSWLISNNLSKPLFHRSIRAFAAGVYFLFEVYQIINHGQNVNAIISDSFYALDMYILLSFDTDQLQKLAHAFCVMLGALLAVSIPVFLLFLDGFPLPNFTVTSNNNLYTFSNYIFFLVSINTTDLIPRFQSFFNEPGHLGTVCSLLLFTQIGRWKRWYNILLVVALFLSFSLAGYVLFVIVVFLGLWMKRRHMLPKILAAIGVIAVVGVGAYFYNNGNNMVNQLILARLEVDKTGKLSGDNRVSEGFENEYNDFIKSGDILLGREYAVDKYGFGNSGYRVFIYGEGLLGVLFAVIFYILMTANATDRRAVISMWVFVLAAFWVRATPFAFYNIIPLYITAYWTISKAHLQPSENGAS